jgi:hypothetical protein
MPFGSASESRPPIKDITPKRPSEPDGDA